MGYRIIIAKVWATLCVDCKATMFLEGVALVVVVYLGLRLTGFFAGGVCKSDTVLAGRVAVITGANTGIGLETAVDFVRRGVSTVILGCRCVKSKITAT